jgi:hypothetical protein
MATSSTCLPRLCKIMPFLAGSCLTPQPAFCPRRGLCLESGYQLDRRRRASSFRTTWPGTIVENSDRDALLPHEFVREQTDDDRKGNKKMEQYQETGV